jgi:hypothetical protein
MHNFQLKIKKHKKWVDRSLACIIVAAFIALVALVYYRVVPVALVDIKVPVATDKSSYYPGQKISGIFFGKVFYTGKVEVVREVYCKDFQATIKTDEGSDVFRGVSRPSELKGDSRYIGHLPADIPIGSNCVIQFANIYRLETPFGPREETVVYYTQNFAIITKERRDQLDCEATGNKDCNFLNNNGQQSTAPVDEPGDPQASSSGGANTDIPLYPPQNGSSGNSSPSDRSPVVPQNDSGTSNTVPEKSTPAPDQEQTFEPVTPPSCSVKLLGLLCVKL